MMSMRQIERAAQLEFVDKVRAYQRRRTVNRLTSVVVLTLTISVALFLAM